MAEGDTAGIKRDSRGNILPPEPIVEGQRRSNRSERKHGKLKWLENISETKEVSTEPQPTEEPEWLKVFRDKIQGN